MGQVVPVGLCDTSGTRMWESETSDTMAVGLLCELAGITAQ